METIVIAGVIVAGTYLLARKSPLGRRLLDKKTQPQTHEKLPLGMSDKDYIKKVMDEDNIKFQREAKIAQERSQSEKDFL